MGQSLSKKQSTFVFGSTVSVPIYKEPDEDNVLFKPFLYGLSTASLSSSTTLTYIPENTENDGRTDSGFLVCEQDAQLVQDLAYVDQTYYSDFHQQSSKKKTVLPRFLRQKKVVDGQLTLDDLSSICFDRPLHDLNLSKRWLGTLNSNFGLLYMVRRLDLSFNYLEEIPESIGHLQQLESLNLAHNDLCSLPKTISYLTRLEDLNLSYNQLETITPHIGHLEKLQTLCVSNNHLIELTVGIKGLINLSVLDISNNKVTTLPAEITQLPFLRRLRLDGCPLTNSLDHYSVRHDPPSLLETCARLIVKNDIYPVSEQASLTEPLEDYLRSYNLCSHCNAPYFESFVSRGRWIEKNDIWIPLEYRLCSAHWSDESDRMYAMFSSNPKNPPLLSKRPDAAIYDTTLTKQNKSRKSRYQLLSSNGTIEDQEEEEAASMSKQWRIKVTNRPSFWRKARLVQR